MENEVEYEFVIDQDYGMSSLIFDSVKLPKIKPIEPAPFEKSPDWYKWGQTTTSFQFYQPSIDTEPGSFVRVSGPVVVEVHDPALHDLTLSASVSISSASLDAFKGCTTLLAKHVIELIEEEVLKLLLERNAPKNEVEEGA